MATSTQLDAIDTALLAAHQEVGNAKATAAARDTAQAGVTAAQATLDTATQADAAETVKLNASLAAVTDAIAAANTQPTPPAGVVNP